MNRLKSNGPKIILTLISGSNLIADLFEKMNVSSPGLYGHQQDPERFAQAIAHIESKAQEVRINIEQLLFQLDLQEKVPWLVFID